MARPQKTDAGSGGAQRPLTEERDLKRRSQQGVVKASAPYPTGVCSFELWSFLDSFRREVFSHSDTV